MNSHALNGGDAAILLGEVAALRDVFGDGVEIEIAEAQPFAAGKRYPELRFFPGFHAKYPALPRWQTRGPGGSFRRRRTSFAVWLLARAPKLAKWLMEPAEREHVDRIESADAIVFTGGTNLVEHYSFTKQLDEIIAAEAVGTPVFMYTQSMGPYRKESNRKLMARLLSRCAMISIRDERSMAYVLEVGVPTKLLAVHPDAAFALARPSAPTAALAETRRVAISVRNWSHAARSNGGDAREAYRQAIAEAARALALEGVEVVFVSTCQGIPEYWTDDARFARSIVADHLQDVPRVSIDSSFHSPSELIALYGTFDAVIATRMHAAILALIGGTPVVGIAYEFKSRELLRSFGMEDLVADFDEISGEWLTSTVRRVLSNGPALRSEIRARVAGFHDGSIAPARDMRSILESRGLRVPVRGSGPEA